MPPLLATLAGLGLIAFIVWGSLRGLQYAYAPALKSVIDVPYVAPVKLLITPPKVERALKELLAPLPTLFAPDYFEPYPDARLSDDALAPLHAPLRAVPLQQALHIKPHLERHTISPNQVTKVLPPEPPQPSINRTLNAELNPNERIKNASKPLDLSLHPTDAYNPFGDVTTGPIEPTSPSYPLLDFGRLTQDNLPTLNFGYDGKVLEEHAFKVGIERDGVSLQTKLKTTPEGAELQGVEIKIDLP
ncbi:hypothetical protein [Thiomicrorhabdus aquaedulcis]|uniref:hypothetical protein n=1 Tax=Thiomicrorhabdus aquaedulcis TaxID=2211106 RepID=UPI000FDA996B|nr:hypothetical protein [Thiomicrorhabdus aquaedulcis]